MGWNVISEGWILFLDDVSIQSRSGIERVWHQPVKHAGNPVIRADRPWEGRNVYVFGTVIRSADGWRMWYESYNPKVKTRDRTNVCLATSEDGFRWSKPSLGIVEFQGDAANNIVLQKSSEKAGSLYSPSVLIDPTEPARPYKMFWHDSGFQVERNGRLYGVSAAYSQDGVRWIRYPENPINLESHDVLAVIYDERIGKFVAYTKTHHENKRARSRAETADILLWPEPELMLHADDQDTPDTEIYWSVHQPYADMYVGLVGLYLTESDVISTEFVFSRDGRRWSRTRRVFLPFGGPGEFDAMMMCSASPPFIEQEDEILFYYGGR